EHRYPLLALIAHDPRSSVEVHQHGRRARPIGTRLAVEIEAMGTSGVLRVGNVADPLDLPRSKRQHRSDSASVPRAPLKRRHHDSGISKRRLEVPTRPEPRDELHDEAHT